MMQMQTTIGREFDSHLELGVFSELSGTFCIRILLFPNYIVQSWFCGLVDGSPLYSLL